MSENKFTQAEYFGLFLHRIRGHRKQLPNRPPVKAEQTFERDLELCDLHRKYGYDIPACDIDFLEYNQATPVALIEYKKRINWETVLVDRDANLRALIKLGNRAHIPVYVVFYSLDRSMYRVCPQNTYATARQDAMNFWPLD